MPSARRVIRRSRRTLRRALAPAAGLILLYHRIAPPDIDPWGLAVSPDHLADHLAVLRESARPTTVDRLADGARRRGRPAVVVTFDDGYVDTLALTDVASNDIPVTVYVTTAGMLGNGVCWWDVLGELLLRPGRVPGLLELTIGSQRYRWDLGADRDYPRAQASRHVTWRAGEEPPTARHRVYFDVWLRLVDQPTAEQQRVLEELRRWAEYDGMPAARLMTRGEVVQLAAHPSVTIGAHTIRHPKLTVLDGDTLLHEITTCRRQLHDATGRAPAHFAYPHGAHDAAVAAAVDAAGYATAVTTTATPVPRRADPFRLPRVAVPDVDRGPFAAWLRRLWRAPSRPPSSRLR